MMYEVDYFVSETTASRAVQSPCFLLFHGAETSETRGATQRVRDERSHTESLVSDLRTLKDPLKALAAFGLALLACRTCPTSRNQTSVEHSN